jgi:hypothetical protein
MPDLRVGYVTYAFFSFLSFSYHVFEEPALVMSRMKTTRVQYDAKLPLKAMGYDSTFWDPPFFIQRFEETLYLLRTDTQTGDDTQIGFSIR